MSKARERSRRLTRTRGVLALGMVLAVVGLVVGWSMRAVFVPISHPGADQPFTYAVVEQGRVGTSLTLNAVAAWHLRPAGINRAVGVVTGIATRPGRLVRAGDKLYSVNLRPVVAAQGMIPSFRTISAGTSGPDVRELQGMLETLGLYEGQPTGLDDSSTVLAVQKWQKSLGIRVDGVVRPGDVIYVRRLPVRVALDPKVITVGTTLVGGEQSVRALPTAPSLSVPMTATQAALVPRNTRVKVAVPGGGTWAGVVGPRHESAAAGGGGVTVSILGRAGRPVCGDTCAKVPVGRRSLLRARLITVPSVSGLVVPTAALTTSASGAVEVITSDGARVNVRVLASAVGMSAINGVNAGLRVRVPAETE